MRAFVTGANGYIGFNVALALRRAGHRVTGLIRQAERAGYFLRHEITPLLGDVSRPEGWAAVAAECDVLVHSAFARDGAPAATDRVALGTLLEVARGAGGPRTLVYTSGVWVYGDTGGRAVDETAPRRPAAAVTWRPAHEDLVLGASHLRGIVVRPGCVYGKQGGLTGSWFAGATGRAPFEVVGDGSNRWAMVHVWDLAEAYVRIAESGAGGEVFNVADPSRATVGEMVRAAAHAAGFEGEMRFVPVPEAERAMGPVAAALSMNQQVDAGKLRRKTGWSPRFGGFLEDVPTYLEAWRAAG